MARVICHIVALHFLFFVALHGRDCCTEKMFFTDLKWEMKQCPNHSLSHFGCSHHESPSKHFLRLSFMKYDIKVWAYCESLGILWLLVFTVTTKRVAFFSGLNFSFQIYLYSAIFQLLFDQVAMATAFVRSVFSLTDFLKAYISIFRSCRVAEPAVASLCETISTFGLPFSVNVYLLCW